MYTIGLRSIFSLPMLALYAACLLCPRQAQATPRYGVFELKSIDQLASTEDKLCDPGSGDFSAAIEVLKTGRNISINGHTVPMSGVSQKQVAEEHTLIFAPSVTSTGELSSFLLVDASADCRYHFQFVEKPSVTNPAKSSRYPSVSSS